MFRYVLSARSARRLRSVAYAAMVQALVLDASLVTSATPSARCSSSPFSPRPVRRRAPRWSIPTSLLRLPPPLLPLLVQLDLLASSSPWPSPSSGFLKLDAKSLRYLPLPTWPRRRTRVRLLETRSRPWWRFLSLLELPCPLSPRHPSFVRIPRSSSLSVLIPA